MLPVLKMLPVFSPEEASKTWHSHQNVSPSDFLPSTFRTLAKPHCLTVSKLSETGNSVIMQQQEKRILTTLFPETHSNRCIRAGEKSNE